MAALSVMERSLSMAGKDCRAVAGVFRRKGAWRGEYMFDIRKGQVLSSSPAGSPVLLYQDFEWKGQGWHGQYSRLFQVLSGREAGGTEQAWEIRHCLRHRHTGGQVAV